MKTLTSAKQFIRIVGISSLLLLSACATKYPHDPMEGLNRATFKFNKVVDNNLFKPIAKTYVKIAPMPVRTGVHNFYSNLYNLPSIPNYLLQGNLYNAIHNIWRTAINSTVGLLGLIDVAKHVGLDERHTDLGVTLGKWGYEDSPYFVVPFFGPSTLRDFGGIGVDYYFFSIYPYIDSEPAKYALFGVELLNWRANMLSYKQVAKTVAIDRYVFERDAYLQRRNYLIKGEDHPDADLYIEEDE